jgi:hypothetical protein
MQANPSLAMSSGRRIHLRCDGVGHSHWLRIALQLQPPHMHACASQHIGNRVENRPRRPFRLLCPDEAVQCTVLAADLQPQARHWHRMCSGWTLAPTHITERATQHSPFPKITGRAPCRPGGWPRHRSDGPGTATARSAHWGPPVKP